MPKNVLVILDEVTQDVLRVVVPDDDAQLDRATFHGKGEAPAKVDFAIFSATPDLTQLKDAAVAEIAKVKLQP